MFFQLLSFSICEIFMTFLFFLHIIDISGVWYLRVLCET